MIRVCPQCGVENGASSIHCRNCRGKLPEPSADMRQPPQSMRIKSFFRATFRVVALLAVGAAGFWASENIDVRKTRSGADGVCSNWQHIQSNAVNAVHRWYAKWLTAEPVPVPVSAAVPAPSPAPVPENIIKVRCKRCKGLGYTGDAGSKSTCLLCNQNGGRSFVLPTGAEVCHDCQGMGQVVAVIHGTERRMVCKMCMGKGYIVRKY